MDIKELPICQQKWLDINNSMHPVIAKHIRQYNESSPRESPLLLSE